MTLRGIPLWPRSLGGQLVALLLIALIVAQVFTLWMFADERRGALVDQARGSIVSRTAAIVRLLEETPEPLNERILDAVSNPVISYWLSKAPAVEATGRGRGERKLVALLDEEIGDGRDIRVDVTRSAPPPRRFLIRHRQRPGDDDAGDEDRDSEGGGDGDRQYRTALRLWSPPPMIALGMSVALSDGRWLNLAAHFRLPHRSMLPMIVSVALMATAIVVIVAVTVRRLTRPLRELAAAADRLGRGTAVEPIPETGPIEVSGTIRAFNVMQDRLTRFVRDRTRMLAAISHDLRTPITSLRIRAEFIDDDENRERIIETLDEMNRMAEATLAFARDEATAEAPSRVDMGEYLDSLAEDYRAMGQPVTLAIPNERIVVGCRPTALRRALRNLIDNALRYGGKADLALAAPGEDAVITITDAGPGIPEERMADVFEPFVRLEESRSEETGGIGLGLAIARSIIHAHGGTVTLANRPEGGLAATVRLPRETA